MQQQEVVEIGRLLLPDLVLLVYDHLLLLVELYIPTPIPSAILILYTQIINHHYSHMLSEPNQHSFVEDSWNKTMKLTLYPSKLFFPFTNLKILYKKR
jgi:hypothetical protein